MFLRPHRSTPGGSLLIAALMATAALLTVTSLPVQAQNPAWRQDDGGFRVGTITLLEGRGRSASARAIGCRPAGTAAW